MKSISKLLTLATLLGSLSACNNATSNDPYQSAWFDIYGHGCSQNIPSPGCNYYSNGMKIWMYQDPFYYPGITFTNGFWYSPTGIIYDSFGNALNAQGENAEISADVIAQSATLEKQVAITAGKSFAQKYALAEDKGILISQTLQSWAILAKDRARTDADVSEYAKRLYGVELSRAKNAMILAATTQNQQPLEDLNVDVAAHWGTTPEVSKQILKAWYQQELSGYGIK